MKKGLSEIDRVYSRMNDYASAADKIKYCIILIQKTENYLTGVSGSVTDHMLTTSTALIEAAKEEIGSLNKSSN